MIKINHNICLTIIIIILVILIIKKSINYNNNFIENFVTIDILEDKNTYTVKDLKQIADRLNIKYKKNITLNDLYNSIKKQLELIELKVLAKKMDKTINDDDKNLNFLNLLNLIAQKLTTIGYENDENDLKDLLNKLEKINDDNQEYYKSNLKLQKLYYDIKLVLKDKQYKKLEDKKKKEGVTVSKEHKVDKSVNKYDTTLSMSIDNYEKEDLINKAKLLGIEYQINGKTIDKVELYYKIKYHNKYLEKLKYSEKDYDKNMKEYNNSLEDFLTYQKQQNNNIDLFSIGKDIEEGILELAKTFDTSVLKEGFVNIENKKDYYEKLEKYDNTKQKYLNKLKQINNKNSKTYKLLKEKYNHYNKMFIKVKDNNPFKMQKEEFNSDGVKKELDENILDFLKYIFEEIYKCSIQKINIFDSDNSNFTTKILNFFKNDIFKNEQTLIGGGILLIIISMGLYFMDISI